MGSACIHDVDCDDGERDGEALVLLSSLCQLPLLVEPPVATVGLTAAPPVVAKTAATSAAQPSRSTARLETMQPPII